MIPLLYPDPNHTLSLSLSQLSWLSSFIMYICFVDGSEARYVDQHVRLFITKIKKQRRWYVERHVMCRHSTRFVVITRLYVYIHQSDLMDVYTPE